MLAVFLFEWQFCAGIENLCRVWKYGVIGRTEKKVRSVSKPADAGAGAGNLVRGRK
jgi:hypothetical protein